MIEILIACSPPLDGRPFRCPSPDFVLEKKVTRTRVTEDKESINPFEYVTIYNWKYEFKDD